MKSKVATRFIQCIDSLKDRGTIRSFRQFALMLDYLPQSLSEIKNGKRDVPLSLLTRAIETFQLNPMYLFLGIGEPFLKGQLKENGGSKFLAVIVDSDGHKLINCIPKDRFADYAKMLDDTDFLLELPTLRLTHPNLQKGNYRAFEMPDNTMSPIFEENDILVCKNIPPVLWNKKLNDKDCFVVVTREDVHIGHVTNRILEEHLILVYPQNDTGASQQVPTSQLREIWKVEFRITDRFNNLGEMLHLLQNLLNKANKVPDEIVS